MWNGELIEAARARVRFLGRLGLPSIILDSAGHLLANGFAGRLPAPFELQGERVILKGEDAGRAFTAAMAALLTRPPGAKTMFQAGPACLVHLLHERIGAAPVVIAMPVDRHLGNRVCPDCLRAAFGFSARESELAAHVGAGRSLTSAAASLGISLATARTHLRHIFMKAGIETQNELVAIVAATAFGHCPGANEPAARGANIIHMN